MLNTRLEVVKGVAAELMELERLIDGALVRHAKLQIAAIEGRRRARLPLDSAQAGLDQLAIANARLIDARAAVHAAHYSFRNTQHEMGLGAVSFGDYGDTPPPEKNVRLGILPQAIGNAA